VLFNSYTFILGFAPAVFASFLLLRRQRPRLVLLIVASYVFYGWAAWWFPLLMVSSTAISFTGGLLVGRTPPGPRRTAILWTAVAGCLALLGVFKYASFAEHYTSALLSTLTGRGLPFQDFVHGIVLPAGISFFTFEAISYVVDVHRGDLEAERDPLRYALFISFFPHLIAGPIVRYGVLRPQLERFWRFDADGFRSGLLLFTLGLGKKVLLADQIATPVNAALADPSALGALDAWTAIVGFSFQIYLDFSAYSDMALGLARMVGIELPWNFDRPYRSASPREFWRRWHVTLSTWLRDYVYISLGGNRKGERRRDANLAATMALGGLWHGASLNFVVWGLYHGGLLVGSHRAGRSARLPRGVAVAVTFLLVTLGWVFFRMTGMDETLSVFAALFGLHGGGEALTARAYVPIAIAALLMWGLPEERTWRLERFGYPRIAAVAALLVVSLFWINQSRVFLYFRF
jgi:alginate O-acetyltransferase complex protein AlgI